MSRPEITRHSSLIARGAALLLALSALLLLPALTPRAEAKSRKASGGRQHHAGGSNRAYDRVARQAINRTRNHEKTTGKTPAPPIETTPAPPPTETTPVPPPSETAPIPPPIETTPVPPPIETSPVSTPPEASPAPIAGTVSPDLLYSGIRINNYWLNQSAPNAITETPDPAGGPQSVFKMTVADSDVYPITPTDNPRAQLMSPPSIQPGEELWWHSRFYLPGDFPSSVPGWLNLLEGPYGAPFNGSPPWQIQVVGNYIQWTRNKTYNWDVPWRMPLVKEKWVDVLVHEQFASSGWVEMWINGQPITFFAGGTYNPGHAATTTRLGMATMDSSNNGGPNSIILQSYRQAGMFSSVSVYEGQLQIGHTRASVGA
jgi:hypothetical protein